MSASRRREWGGRLALVVLGIGLGVLGLELAVRLALDVYACDDELGWTFEPDRTALWTSRAREFLNVVRIDAHGLHDAGRPLAKPPDTWRAVLLGDSFFAALQVPREEAFPARVERALAPRLGAGHRIELVNAGVDGYGQGQALLLLRRLGLRFEPDLVVLGVHLSNDLADNAVGAGSWNHRLAERCGRPYFDPGTPELVLLPPGADAGHRQGGWRGFALRHSALYGVWSVATTRGSRERGARPSFEQWHVFWPDAPPALEASWGLTQRLVLGLRDELAARGIPLLVVNVPDKRELGIGTSAWDDALDLDYRRARDRLVPFVRRSGLAFLDLAPPLQAAARGGPPPYFAVDLHWTAAGHEVVADALAGWLEAHCAEVGLPLEGCDASRTPPGSAGDAGRTRTDQGR